MIKYITSDNFTSEKLYKYEHFLIAKHRTVNYVTHLETHFFYHVLNST